MNRMRLRIAERLKQSQNTAASLTTFNEVDMSNIMEFRKLYKEDVLKKTGVKLGFMSAFSRACVLAMRALIGMSSPHTPMRMWSACCRMLGSSATGARSKP